MIKNLCGIRMIMFLLIFATHFKYVIIYSDVGRSLFRYMDIGRISLMSFFLLSGFCTALGYTDKFVTCTKSAYLHYVKSRFIKFYPLYLITGVIAFLMFFLPQGVHWLYSFIFYYVTMLFPWLGVQGGGNGVGWFLSAIFFCYLLTPPLLLFINKFKDIKSHIIFILINYLVLGVFSLTLAYFNDISNEFLFRFPPIRFFEYAIALDLGCIYVKFIKNQYEFKVLNNYWIKSIFDIIFILIMLYCLYGFPNSLVYRHFFSMPLIIIFFLYLCNESKSILTSFLSSKPMLYLGSISFECYLIHPIIMDSFKEYSKDNVYTIEGIVYLFIIIMLLTILFSILGKFIQDFAEKKYSIRKS